jgi:hypothetical protein
LQREERREREVKKRYDICEFGVRPPERKKKRKGKGNGV